MNEFRRGERPSVIEQPRERKIDQKHETTQKIAGQMKDLVREYGLDALKEMLAKMQNAVDGGRGIKAEELLEVIEARPEHSAFQKEALETLEDEGYIELRDDEVYIVDDQKLFGGFSLKELKRKDNRLSSQFENFSRSRLEFLGNAFVDTEVVLKSEYEQNPEAPAKPFFYLPKTREDALDPKKIRQSEFHYGLWEIPRITSDSTGVTAPQPASLTEQSFFETSVAALLYHPQYGNGQRDTQQRLKVRDGDRFISPTGEWMYKQGLKFSLNGVPNILRHKPREILREHASGLFERGLLQPSDFAREHYTNRMSETSRVATNGMVSIEGVKHYLGRKEFSGKAVRIDNVADGVAAVLELDENGLATPVALINIFQKGDGDLVFRKTHETSGFYEAGGKLTQPRSYSEKEFAQPKPGEDPDAFFKRKQQFETFSALLRFDNTLKQEAGLALFDLSPELRKELQKYGDKIGKNEQLYLDFAKTFGQKGLEMIAASIQNTSLSEQILKTALEIPASEREILLPRLHDALLARRDMLSALEEHKNQGRLGDLEYRQMAFEINRRVTSVLTAAGDSAAIKDSLEAPTKQQALEKITQQGNELVLFSKIFKDAFKGTKEMNFDQIRGVTIEVEKGGEINAEAKDQMLAIFEANWQGQKPELLPALRQGFIKKLEEAQDTQFHILKKDGRVVAFLRFDERPDLEPGALYGGSLNVDPALRGSAIGEAMMKAVIDETAKEHTIYADVFPDLIVGTKYVEELGCVITGVEEVTLGENGKTVKRLLLRRNDQENQTYSREGKGAQTITVDLRKGQEALLSVIEQQTRQGKVATRYFANPTQPHLRTLVFETKSASEQLAAK